MVIGTSVQNSQLPEYLAFEKIERVLWKAWILSRFNLSLNYNDHSISQEISNVMGYFFTALFYSLQVICKTLSSERESSCPNFSEEDLGGAVGEWVCIRQEPFVKMTFFKVNLKCFSMEQSLSRIIYIVSYLGNTNTLPNIAFRKTSVFTRLWNMLKSLQI